MPVDDHGLNLVNEFITTNGIEKMSLAKKSMMLLKMS